MDRIRSYAHKCFILRQIQSNKARWFGYVNAAQNIAVVVISSFLLFIGFSGVDKIHTYVGWFVQIDRDKVEFAFNVLVFLLFVVGILHLVFQFGRRQSESERAIVSLTNLINQVEDLTARCDASYREVTQPEEEIVRNKYEAVISIIPPNSDREFLRAKRDFDKKEVAKQSGFKISAPELFDQQRQRAAIAAIVGKSSQLMEILKVMRETDGRLYLGGGLVRNLVWDYLHSFRSPTPIDDVDVVYFDKLSSTKQHDTELEGRLSQQVPNLRWSVKNQARMHTSNSDEPYQSLEDAVSKWPETATAIASRLDRSGALEFVAPYGFSDLFRLLVVPTPHFRGRIARIRQRATEKDWQKRWPNLKIIID